MRRTEYFGSENREADKRAYGKRAYGEEKRRESGEDIYRELTREGQRFCAAAGLLEEIAVLAALRIDVRLAPVPVLVFLWVLFVILTAAVLIGAGGLLDHAAVLRPLPGNGRRRAVAYPSSARRAAEADGHICGEERVAA